MGLDFYKISTRPCKGNNIEVYPEFKVCKTKDLMIRGKDFYVVYNPLEGKWTTDKVIIQQFVDEDIQKMVDDLQEKENKKPNGCRVYGKMLKDFSSNHWATFDRYVKSLQDNSKVLDSKVTYKNEKTTREDLVSKELPYELHEGPYDAWEEIISTLYDPEEREKIEWAIGAILSGEAKKIQKFLVLYGPQGSGKSTILNIVMKLLEGYYVTFKAESLVNAGDQFGCKFLSSNPLVAIDEDTNLSRIETNATINKIASHEELEVNEKYKAQYVIKPMCMMMLGTNKPVRITDAKSGIIRRLIDIEPSGRKIKPIRHYEALINQVNFELGAIAYHCLEVYRDSSRGMHYYDDYIPERMMYRTDAFLNFMLEDVKDDPGIIADDGIEARRLWDKWKDYCNKSGIEFTRKQFEIIDEAKNYFEYFDDRKKINGEDKRRWLSGLKVDKLILKKEKTGSKLSRKLDSIIKQYKEEQKQENVNKSDGDEYSYGWLHLDQTESIFDKEFADCPAQYTKNIENPIPRYPWDRVKTKLKDINTSELHFVKTPPQLIFFDFDRRDKDGNKDPKENIKLAVSTGLKETYAELSRSGGLHLYYYYDGDVSQLSNVYGVDIEVKTFPDGKKTSIRRKLTRCNNKKIAHISSGLPLKEKKKVINYDGVKDAKHLRNIIYKAIKKEVRPYDEDPKTVTCMQFIRDILKDAQDRGMSYDFRDLSEDLYAFAASSHNSKAKAVDIYYGLELLWPKNVEEPVGNIVDGKFEDTAPIIIFDCEVTKNLLLVVYKELGPDHKCIRLFNPRPDEIEKLFSMKLVGFNNKDYDNRILWAAWLGYSNEQIFQVSQDIIKNHNGKMFREAINVSYVDIFDVSSEKKSLKKFEIEMHFPHKEMEIDWNEPLPESEWERLAQYCENDVLATEAVFLSKKWQADFKARKMLAELTGLTVNESTNNLSAQLIFGDDRNPQSKFVYPDLRKEFPEYRYEMVNGKCISYYGSGDNEVVLGEGGRVYAEWGAHYNVITFDVSGMHPSTIIKVRGFGEYTQNYEDLYKARIAIKHKEYDVAKQLFGGRLAQYLTSDEDADDLAYALKIVLNSAYGETAAHHKNRFRDERNNDNWVAKRGALFMEKLRREVQSRGGHVVHIKTDSIKLVNPSKDLQDFVVQFGKDYGYTFEIESKYERMCLVNNAVYIAFRQKDDPSWIKECKKAKGKAEKDNAPYIEPTRWTATGAQFAESYVFKRMFSHEPLIFWDFCETKTVKTTMYLDLNEKLENVTKQEQEKKKLKTKIKKYNKILETGKDGKKEVSDFDKEKIRAELEDLPKDLEVLNEFIAKGHNYVFIGKTGEFTPVKKDLGGGFLVKINDDGDYDSVQGTKGYRWLESESLQKIDNWKDYIDIDFFAELCNKAIKAIETYTDFDVFVQGDPDILPDDRVPDINDDPWKLPCGSEKYAYCSDCPEFSNDDNKFGYCCKLGYNIENQILGEEK